MSIDHFCRRASSPLHYTGHGSLPTTLLTQMNISTSQTSMEKTTNPICYWHLNANAETMPTHDALGLKEDGSYTIHLPLLETSSELVTYTVESFKTKFAEPIGEVKKPSELYPILFMLMKDSNQASSMAYITSHYNVKGLMGLGFMLEPTSEHNVWKGCGKVTVSNKGGPTITWKFQDIKGVPWKFESVHIRFRVEAALK